MTKPIRTAYLVGLGVSLFCGASLSGSSDSPGALAAISSWARQQAGRGAPPKTGAPAPQQILEGTDENDTLTGGDGDDWLFGKKGLDILRGGRGRDKVDGGEGDDNIDGGDDADILDGGPGTDTIRGGAGADTIDGGDDDDLLDGGDGDDDLDGGDGVDIVRGGGGNDLVAGGDENDTMFGDAGNDRLSGNDGSDALSGGAGDDILKGGEGDDNLSGEAGDDRLDGSDGNDLLRGGAGNDLLLGSSGTDTLHGQAGHDTLLGGDGVDLLDGGLGLDWLFAGLGADVMLGGDGDDICVVRPGDVAAGEVEIINGGAGTDVLFLMGFTEMVAVKGEVRLVDPVTGGLYVISNIERIEYTVILPPADMTATGTVSLHLVNPSSTATAGRVIFFGSDGAILPSVAAGATAATDDVKFTVPALGSLSLETMVKGSAVAQVFSASPIGVSARGAQSTSFVDGALMPLTEDAGAGISTGLMLAGSAADTSVNLSIYSLDGNELDSDVFRGAKEVLVPAYGHVLIFARDLFPNLRDFRGLLSIDAEAGRPQDGGPVSVLRLERTTTGVAVAGVPASTRPPSAGRRAHLAHVTAGGGVESTITLMNPSSARSQGTMHFFDEAGRPWPVAVNGQRAAESVPFELAATAGNVFTIAPGGVAQRGSVRVEAAQGTVTALLRQSSKSGVDHLPLSGEFSSFITPAARDSAAGSTMRLAIASTGSAVTVRLRLRTASGADVAGGTAELKLAANGQATRTLEQLFPSAATDRFNGTLTAHADGGTIAATALLIGSGSQPSTALPMIRVQ